MDWLIIGVHVKRVGERTLPWAGHSSVFSICLVHRSSPHRILYLTAEYPFQSAFIFHKVKPSSERYSLWYYDWVGPDTDQTLLGVLDMIHDGLLPDAKMIYAL